MHFETLLIISLVFPLCKAAPPGALPGRPPGMISLSLNNHVICLDKNTKTKAWFQDSLLWCATLALHIRTDTESYFLSSCRSKKSFYIASWYFIFYPECVRISVQHCPGELYKFVTQYILYVIKNFILYAGSGPPAGNSSIAAFFSLCRCPFEILWCINILWPMAHRCGQLMVVGFSTNNI